jgi:cytoskeleton protein RodZ
VIGDFKSDSTSGAVGSGQCLREARVAAGLTIEDVAVKLHMPLHVVRALEQDDWHRLGAPVFVH